MIASLALSLIAIASGTLLTYAYDEGAPLASRLASGACIGFAAMALVGFVLALLFGLNPSTIGFTAALLLLPLLLLKKPAHPKSNRSGHQPGIEGDQSRLVET